VIGAVANTGVYDLPVDSRVEDAIAISGGFAQDADQESVNLAAELKDGAQIAVPTQKVVQSSSTTPPTTDSKPPVAKTFPININTANQAELETLPGIGPVTAEKIISFRQTNGEFSIIEDIQKVSGIGPATFENIKELITVNE